MSTDIPKPVQQIVPVSSPLSLRELAAVLVKHYGLNEGVFDLMVEFQIGVGAVGPEKDKVVPGAMIGVTKIGLLPSTILGPNTVDAAVINPEKKPSKKARTKIVIT